MHGKRTDHRAHAYPPAIDAETMKRLTLDDVREALPPVEELRPVFDLLLSESEPDAARTWSKSGELGTVGARLVDGGSITQALVRLAAEEGEHLHRQYTSVGQALEALASGDGARAAAAFLQAAALEEQRDRPDRAAAYCRAAHRAARDEKDQAPTALALRRWARALRAQGKLAEAFERYANAHEDGLALADARGAAEAAIGAGNVLEEQGRWTEAARWYRTALDTVESSGGPVPERWHALLNLHIVTRSAGAVENSVELLDEAERAAAEVDPEGSAPFIQNARGQLEMARGKFGPAERYLRAALEADTNPRAHATFRLNLAEALLAQGRELDAAEHAREAEREAIRAGLVSKLPEVYRLLGRIASAEGNPDAFVFFERALELVRERALPALEEALTLQAYAEAEALRDDVETAEQLRRDAAERFQTLGMTHMRQAWADVYGPNSDEIRPSHNRDE